MRAYRSVILKLALGAVATALVLCGVRWLDQEQTLTEVRGALIVRAQAVSSALDAGMLERQQGTESVAKNAVFRGTDATAQRRELELLQTRYPQMAWIGFADASGSVVSATGSLLEGQNVSARPWFSGAKFDTFVGDVHDAKLLAKHLTPEGGELPRFIDIAVPVFSDTGGLLGVLGAHLTSKWLDEVSEPRVFSAADRPADIAVLGREGAVLSTVHEKPETQSDAMVSYEALTSGLGDFRGFGWRVVATAHESSSAATMSLSQILVLIAGSALTGALAWGEFQRAKVAEPS